METQLKTLNCPNCSAPLDPANAVGGVVRCPYCNSAITLPKTTNEKALLKLEIARSLLNKCDFDGAYGAFSEVADAFPDEPEAYYGMALADFKIQLIHDKVNNRLQPVCHNVTEKKFTDGANYKKALKCAKETERLSEYKAQGEEIDGIMDKFYRLSKEGLSYDTFICVKVTDVDGRHTEDSHTADDLYHELSTRGYKPFYSEREIKGRVGADYEALILYALHSARSMLIVCSDESYLKTPWVANEYTRYIELMGDDKKRQDSLAIIFGDMPIEKLPGTSGRIQGICSKSGDAYLRIIEFIERFPAATPKIKRKEYAPVTFKAKQVIQTNIQKRNLTFTTNVEPITASENNKLQLARQLLNSGDFAHATSFAEGILKDNKNLSEAYWIMFLSEYGCKNDNELENTYRGLESWDNFEKAVACADKNKKKRYYNILLNSIKNTHDIWAFEEYFALPDSDDETCKQLLQEMFEYALLQGNGNEVYFDRIIKYVSDTDTYISMNLEFGRITGNTKYYEAVLSVDKSNSEALWQVFINKDVLPSSYYNIAQFCLDKSNFDVIEKKLFSYGFNRFVFDNLFKTALSNVNDSCAADLLDFLLSFVPESMDVLYNECSREVVYCALAEENWQIAARYNDRLLEIDKYDYEAYYIACAINYKTVDSDELRKKCSLLDDSSFNAAMMSYAEKFSNKDNLFLKLANGNGRLTDLYRHMCYKPFTEIQYKYNNLVDVYNEVIERKKEREKAEMIKRREEEEAEFIRKEEEEKRKREERDEKKRIAAEEKRKKEEEKERLAAIAAKAKSRVKKLQITIVAAIIGAVFAIIGIVLIATRKSNLSLTTLFMQIIPLFLVVLICIYICFSVWCETNFVGAIMYAVNFAAIAFIFFCLVYIIYIWNNEDLFAFIKHNEGELEIVQMPPVWARVFVFIGGFILFIRLIIGFVAIHRFVRRGSYCRFMPDGLWSDFFEYIAFPMQIVEVVPLLLIFIGCFGYNGLGNGFRIAYLSVAAISIVIGGIYSLVVSFIDEELINEELAQDIGYIIHSILGCSALGLFVLCAVSVL